MGNTEELPAEKGAKVEMYTTKEVLGILGITEKTLEILIRSKLLGKYGGKFSSLDVNSLKQYRNPVAKNGLFLTEEDVIKYLDIDEIFLNFLVKSGNLRPFFSARGKNSWYFTLTEIGDFKKKHMFNQVTVDDKIFIPEKQAKARGYLTTAELAAVLGVTPSTVNRATLEGRYTPVAYLVTRSMALYDVVTYNQFDVNRVKFLSLHYASVYLDIPHTTLTLMTEMGLIKTSKKELYKYSVTELNNLKKKYRTPLASNRYFYTFSDLAKRLGVPDAQLLAFLNSKSIEPNLTARNKGYFSRSLGDRILSKESEIQKYEVFKQM